MNDKNFKAEKKKVVKKDWKENETNEKVEGKLIYKRQEPEDQELESYNGEMKCSESEKINSLTNALATGMENDKLSENSSVRKTCTQSSHAIKGKKKNPLEEFYLARTLSTQPSDGYSQDLHRRKFAEFLEAFHIFDFDHDGVISHEDLRRTFTSLNQNYVKDEDIQQMLSEGLSPLNFDAFVILLGYKTLDLDPEGVLMDAFSKWDDDHNGLISQERLLHDIMAWGDKFTKEEAESALADAPIVVTKANGKMIDYIQFSEDLCGLRKMIQRRKASKTEAKNLNTK